MSTPDPLDYGALLDQASTTAADQATAAYDPLIAERRAAAEQATRQYDTALAGTPQPPPIPAFDDPVPANHFGAVMQQAPWLFALTALGGKMTKMSGQAMLGGATGMIQGLMNGSEQQYKDARQQYEDNYNKWLEHWRQTEENYKLYLDAYKGRVDADRVAWERALKSVDDAQLGKAKAYGDAKAYARIALGAQQAHEKITKDQIDQWFKERKLKLDQEKADQTVAPGQLPPGFTQDDIDYYARQQLAGDTTWRTGLGRTKGGTAIIAAVDRRVPTIAKEAGISPEAASTTKEERKSLATALNDRQKYVAAGTQFIANFNQQSQLVDKYLEAGAAGATPILNRWIQAGRKQVAGDPEVTALDTAIRGLAREHQRIVTGVTSNGQLHVAAQQTADELANIDQTREQIRATMKVMREEAQNALNAGNEEVATLRKKLSQLGVAGASAGPKEGDKSKDVDGKAIVYRGGKWIYE